MKTNPERARQLAGRGYSAGEIAMHMNEEERDVGVAEVEAWLDYRVPPQMVTFHGQRVTLYSVALAEGMALKTLQHRLETGMSIEEAVRMPVPRAPRPRSENPWRRYPACARRRV